MKLVIFVSVLGLGSIVSAEPAVNQGSNEGQGSQPQYGAPRQEQSSPSQQPYGPPGHTPGAPLGSGGYGQPQSQSCPPNDPQQNMDLVKRVYKEVFSDLDSSNLEKYFAEDYIQHNPMAMDTREGLRHALMGPLGQGPKRNVVVERVAVDGDYVWAHNRFPFMGVDYAVVDIFRFKCGKIQEHWDVRQDTNVMAANPHAFF